MSTLRATTLQHGSSAVQNIVLDNQGRAIFGPDGPQGRAALYVNAQLNRVGVNNESPTVALDVDGAINATGNTTLGGTLTVTGNVSFNADIDADGEFLTIGGMQVTSNLTPTTGAGWELFRSSLGFAQMQAYDRSGAALLGGRINTANWRLGEDGESYFLGNFGIGTSSPEEILHVAAASEAVNSRDGVMLQSTSALAADTGLPLVFSADIGGGFSNYGIASIAGRKENSTSGNAAGYLQFATGSPGGAISEKMRINSNGDVGIGETSLSAGLDVKRDVNPVLAIDRGTADTANFNLQYNGTLTGQLSAANGDFQISAAGASTPISFYANGQERMKIAQNGVIRIGQTTSDAPAAANIAGAAIGQTAYLSISRAGDLGIEVNRISNDGPLMRFLQDGTSEGSISVSGTTVSYNGGHLARWSQLPGGAVRKEILRGTVLSNIDEMCEWGEEDNEQLNRMKVSDVEGDKNVSGVFQAWDDDDDTYTDDFYCAMTGDFVIRIAQGVTVQRGDLLMSAGDGTAKPQDDDIIRSKTIAKVTSTHVTCTYNDGSYCVPCVLMAC